MLAAEFVAGAPEIVMQGDYLAPNNGRPYSVSSDGQRFLMIKDATIAGDSDVLPPQVNICRSWVRKLGMESLNFSMSHLIDTYIRVYRQTKMGLPCRQAITRATATSGSMTCLERQLCVN